MLTFISPNFRLFHHSLQVDYSFTHSVKPWPLLNFHCFTSTNTNKLNHYNCLLSVGLCWFLLAAGKIAQMFSLLTNSKVYCDVRCVLLWNCLLFISVAYLGKSVVLWKSALLLVQRDYWARYGSAARLLAETLDIGSLFKMAAVLCWRNYINFINNSLPVPVRLDTFLITINSDL